MVLLLLSRTISSSETRRKYSDMPVSCPTISKARFLIA